MIEIYLAAEFIHFIAGVVIELSPHGKGLNRSFTFD